MNILKKILGEVENINQLPLYPELIKSLEKAQDEEDGYEIIFNNINETFMLKDGTEVIISDFQMCFKDSRNEMHDRFYCIPEIDTYICLECGLWQKYHTNLFDEVCNEYKCTYGYQEKLLPIDWDDNGVKAYFRKGIEYLNNKETRKLEMIIEQSEDEELCDEGCYDWESR